MGGQKVTGRGSHGGVLLQALGDEVRETWRDVGPLQHRGRVLGDQKDHLKKGGERGGRRERG